MLSGVTPDEGLLFYLCKYWKIEKVFNQKTKVPPFFKQGFITKIWARCQVKNFWNKNLFQELLRHY